MNNGNHKPKLNNWDERCSWPSEAAHFTVCVDRILLSNSENVNVKNWIFRLSVFPVSLTLLSRSLTTVWGSVPANIHGQGSSSRWRNEGLYFRSCPGDTSTFLIVAMKYDALYTFSNISISFTFQIGVRTLYFHNVNDFISKDHHVFVTGKNVIIKPAKLYPYFSRWFRLITVNLKWMSLNMLNMNIILTWLRNIFVNSWCFLWYTGECLSRIHWVVHRNLKTLLPSALCQAQTTGPWQAG